MTADVYSRLINYLSDPDYFDRAELRAALIEAMKWHEPSHKHAGVNGLYGLDTCIYCRDSDPQAVFMGDVNGKWMRTHCHGFRDYCEQCPAEPGGDFELSYPCSPVKAICKALGVAL